MSKRKYVIKEIDKRLRRAADLDIPIAIGGGTVLATSQHTLEGPEHSERSGALLVRAVISPSQLVANTDNWSPTGLATADAIRVSTDASRNLTGIVAPTGGFQAIVLANIGAFDLVLKHDVTSTAANRFLCPNDTDVTLQKRSTAILVYDLTTTRWRVIGGGGGGGSGVATDPIWDTKGDLAVATAADAASKLVAGANGTALVARSAEATGLKWEDQILTLNFIIDGGGAVVTTGIKGDVIIDFACSIVAATLLADVSGSTVVDIWKDTYANFPPVDADSITASAPPTISSATKSQDSTLTGWTTAIAAGDVLRFNVDSASTVTRLTLSLKLKRT